MKQPKARRLIKRYLSNSASEKENALLETWYVEELRKIKNPDRPVDYEKVGQEILDQLRKSQQNPTMLKLWLPKISAAVVLIIGFTIFAIIRSRQNDRGGFSYEQEILPGKQAATLTLSNGKKILLNETSNVRALMEAGVTLSETKKGELVYSTSDANKNDSNLENTLYTANGQNFKVVLQDGSTVWLNAGSSLSYPVSFKNLRARKVRLSGEAYFEVKPQPDAPFRVLTNKEEIVVLGTHFNVRSYPDQAIRQTTLLEGKVEVSALDKPGIKKILKPGQQLSFDGKKSALTEVDAEEAIAWKEGLFYFNEQQLEIIMQDIGKWYNVKVVFKNESLKKILYSGSLSKYAKVSQVLQKIEQIGGVKFVVSGDHIIVEKN